MPTLRGTAEYGGTGSAGLSLSSFTVAKPAGVVSGDLILIYAINGSYAPVSFTAPSGFSSIPATNVSGYTVQLWYRLADGTEGSAFTVAMSGNANAAGVCIAYSGANLPVPFDPSTPSGSGTGAASTTAVTAASITTAKSGDQVVWFGASLNRFAAGSVITAPSGYTAQGAGYHTTSSVGGCGILAADMTQATYGATGSAAGSVPSANTETFAVQIAIDSTVATSAVLSGGGTLAPAATVTAPAAATVRGGGTLGFPSTTGAAMALQGGGTVLASAAAVPPQAVNQWAATFAQPAVFGNMPPALQSVVVPLNAGSSVGGGTGTSTPGNWLFCVVGWNQADALPSVDFGDGDDIHSFWRPGGVSGSAGSSGTSIWYTPNIARQVNDVYVAPNGAMSGASVTVIEVAGLGPWDTVTGVDVNDADAATSLNLALAAPSAQALLIAAVTCDSTAAGLTFTPAGWTALSTVTASNGTNHVSDVVLASAILPATSGSVSVTATASSTDLSGVILGVMTSAPSPIPDGWNPAWPYLKFEFAPGGGFETPPDQLEWVWLANRLWSWRESTGVQYQLAQLMSTDGSMQVDNFDGSLSPSNPGGLWYSNALNVNMSFNAPYPYGGVAPWTGVGGAALSQSSTYAFASAPNATATYSCEVTPDGTTASPGAQSEMDPVTAGDVYSASAWFYSVAGWSTGARAAIKWFNSSSTLISTSTVSATAIPAATWTQVTQLGVTAPAGAAYASVVPEFAGTPSAAAPYRVAEACIVAGSLPPVTGRVTTGTPVRLRMALGTIGGVTVNRWYVWSRNALSWPEKRNKAMRNFVEATFADLWAVASKSSPTPYRGEVEQDAPGWWWPMDDQPGLGGVLPTSLRNAAIGSTAAMNITLSPAGGQPQDPYTVNGYDNFLTSGTQSIATYTVAADSGWMYGDPQSGLQSAQSGGAVTAQPGSASWQQTGAAGNTGSYGWFLSCHDTFPSIAGGVTVEKWFNWALFGSASEGVYTISGHDASAAMAAQPYSPLTLLTLTTASAVIAVLQLDVSGHLHLITYNGSTPTSHAIYTTSDLRSANWHQYVVELTATTWTVYVDGGLTALASGTVSAMATSWEWLILNGDMGTADGGSTTDIAHGGNVAISHASVYGYLLPAYRVMAHYCAALTGFGQIPAPSSPALAWLNPGITPDGSTIAGDPPGADPAYLGQGRYGGTTNDATANMSVVVTASAGSYTSGPAAWQAATAYGTYMAAWVSWGGLAPENNIYTADQLGSELHAAVATGTGDALDSGYGSSTAASGYCHVSGGTGASPPAAASALGDTVGQRLERLLGYGNITAPRRCIDPAPLLVQGALDIGGAQAGSNCNNIVQSDNGLLFVDSNGSICYRGRPHLAADEIVWYIGMNVAAGMIPFEGDIIFGNDPARVVDDVEVTPYAPDGSTPPVLTPTDAVAVNAAQQQYGDRPQQVTSYLQDPVKQQSQANWLFGAFSSLQRRIEQLTINAATHPAAWPFVLASNIGDLVQVYDTPFGAPATTGVYRITHLDRSIGYGANGGSVVGSAKVTADPVPPGGYWA